MYISFKGKVYRFREGVREGGERGMGAAERRIGQDKRGEWNGTERGTGRGKERMRRYDRGDGGG